MTVNISDDDVSGEPIQQYDLMLVDVPASVAVSPLNSTTVNIFDNDREWAVLYICIIGFLKYLQLM